MRRSVFGAIGAVVLVASCGGKAEAEKQALAENEGCSQLCAAHEEVCGVADPKCVGDCLVFLNAFANPEECGSAYDDIAACEVAADAIACPIGVVEVPECVDEFNAFNAICKVPDGSSG